MTAANTNVHMHLTGPTGAGKSFVMSNAALDLIRARSAAVILIDPKDGKTVQDVMERVPREHWERVAVMAPWGAGSERPLGLNLLECEGPAEWEVVADRVVTIFKRLYKDAWGPRVEDVMRVAVLTLLRHPGTTLVDIPQLLLDPVARRRWTRNLDDPIGLEPFWRQYEQTEGRGLSKEVSSVLYKLRAVLLRPTVRSILGQSRSTVDLGHLMDHQGVLLVSLPAGVIGDETTQLIAAVLVARIWQVLRATRTGRPERPPVVLMADEFHDLVVLPQTWEKVLAEARSFGLGLVLAHQHLGQLPASAAQAIASNALHKVAFRPAHLDEAKGLAKGLGLSEYQLMALRSRQVAVRLGANGVSGPPFTGYTRPLPAGFGGEHATELLEAALERFGRDREEVEAEILDRYGRPPALAGKGLEEDSQWAG